MTFVLEPIEVTGNEDSAYLVWDMGLVIEINYMFFTFSISLLKLDRWECFSS